MHTTILRAQLWELWRLTWLDMLVRIGGMLVFLGLFSWMPDEILDYMQGIVLGAVVLVSVISRLWVSSYEGRKGGGFPFYLGFTRPIPVLWLVAVPMIWLMISNVLVFIVLTSTVESIFHWRINQLGYIPAILLFSGLVTALLWSTDGLSQLLATLGMLACGTFWLLRLVSASFPSVTPESSVVSQGYLPTMGMQVFMLVGTVLVVWICIGAIQRLRFGEPNTLRVEEILIISSAREYLDRVDGFRSARHAQWWIDLHRIGKMALGFVLAGLALLLTISAGASLLGDESEIFGLWFVALLAMPHGLACIAIDCVHGIRRSNTFGLSIFEAIRPLTTRQCVERKFSLILVTAMTGWVVFLLGVTVIVAVFHRETMSFVPYGFIGAGLLLTTSACVAIIPLIMSAAYLVPQLGRHPVTCSAFVAFVASIAVFEFEDLIGRDLAWAAQIVQVLWGLFLILVTLGSLRRAARAGYFSPPLLFAVGIAVLLFLASLQGVAAYTVLKLPSVSYYSTVLISGLLSLPLASVAWAPQLLATLRHR